MSEIPERDAGAGQAASQQSASQEEPEVTTSSNPPSTDHTPEDFDTPGTPEHTGAETSPPQGERCTCLSGEHRIS